MFTKSFIGRVVIITILSFSFAKMSYAKVIVVDSSGAGDYTIIQEAVANADSGDTVFVRKGTYFAPTLQDTFGSIDLNVPLYLLG
jgi:hypothetical protein